MSNVAFDGRELDQFEGMISAAEAELLYRRAALLGAGCIVELGSWRGKSAIALARGAQAQPPDRRPMVHCIEPHAEFVGVYGGKFGPVDRKMFYEAMLRAGCTEGVALINLSSAAGAKAWSTPIGLLFVDGDHSQDAVKADVDSWAPFIIDGGFIAFDHAIDRAVGPAHVIAAMLESGLYRCVETVGKIVVLQKKPDAERQLLWKARTDAIADIGQRALALGYDRDFAVARLDYGSFVSRQHKYMYVETPKAACTSWKRLIIDVEDAFFDYEAPLHHRETRRDMLIHQRRHVGMPTLLDVGASERDDVLSASGDWFVFAISRNPFSRITSVFENKVRLGEPGYEALEARFGDRAKHASVRDAFAAFVRELVAEKALWGADAHLRGQVELLMPRLVPYTRVFRLEDGDAALTAYRAQLSRHGYGGETRLQRTNASVGRNWRDYYEEASAAIVAAAYADDFRTFGYDPTDWRGGAPIPPATQDEQDWREQVVERNAMIARLHRERER